MAGLRGITKHSDTTWIATSKLNKAKVVKFATDHGYTIASVLETMIDVFLDAYPHLNLKTSYDRRAVVDAIKARKGQLKPLHKPKTIKETK